jgi:hypothetical protein
MKNPSRTALPALCAAFFLSACQSSPNLSDSWSTVEIGDRFEVSYSGELRAQPSARMGGMPPADGLQSGILDAGMAKPPQQWVVHLELVQMSRAAVDKLLPGAFPPGGPIEGGRLNRTEFQHAFDAMIEAKDAVNLSSPTVLCNGGEHAWVTMLQQNAFINGFEYKRALGALIADPEVGVFHSGLAVGLLPSQSAFANKALLKFDLTLTDLLEMDTITAEFPRETAPLSLQVPVFSEQTLSGEVHLAADEAAFLPYFYTTDDQLMMIFITAESVGEVQKQL